MKESRRHMVYTYTMGYLARKGNPATGDNVDLECTVLNEFNQRKHNYCSLTYTWNQNNSDRD